MGCSRGVPGLFRAVPGCSGGVPGFSGVFRGVPGCSGSVPGFTDTPLFLFTLCAKWNACSFINKFGTCFHLCAEHNTRLEKIRTP